MNSQIILDCAGTDPSLPTAGIDPWQPYILNSTYLRCGRQSKSLDSCEVWHLFLIALKNFFMIEFDIMNYPEWAWECHTVLELWVRWSMLHNPDILLSLSGLVVLQPLSQSVGRGFESHRKYWDFSSLYLYMWGLLRY